jgi:alkaline phosphatase D
MSITDKKLTRRSFVAGGVATAMIGCTQVTRSPQAPVTSGKFVSDWERQHNRVWIGPTYWANPLQDWRLSDGRLECYHAAADRTLHCLSHQLSEKLSDFEMRVTLGKLSGDKLKGKGSAGFRVGIQGPLKDYQNSLLSGVGLDAGITGTGHLFIGDKRVAIDLGLCAVELYLTAISSAEMYTLTLSAHSTENDSLLAKVKHSEIPATALTGNIALVSNYSPAYAANGHRKKHKSENTDTFWFRNWQSSGSKLQGSHQQAFGPILFSQYTLSRHTMKMSAQLPPLGAQDTDTLSLQLATQGENWQTVATEKIHPEARVAQFRINDWHFDKDIPYRLVYRMSYRDGSAENYYWPGTVRRDPVEQETLTVADISCNTHQAFPNTYYVNNIARLNPDLLAFVGDQYYESTGGYGLTNSPNDLAMLDVLRRWYIHGWSWRELLRDRPSITIPDDHDVLQGNIWGMGGRVGKQAQDRFRSDDAGYRMPANWVNNVHLAHTGHHPDPYDPNPTPSGISNYYGPLTYGRVSFAVLADRMYKSAPKGTVSAPGVSRADHVKTPDFDPDRVNKPGLELLANKQLEFIRSWAADWSGADMKAVISQTIFTSMATTHGNKREVLVADYDTNGWPQTPRDQALREIRKAFAVHIAGDQHLPALVQYGIDNHRDGPVAFAGPAVNVGYPRWWEPAVAGQNLSRGAAENTGDFNDSFGNLLTVHAVANGAKNPSKQLLLQLMDDKTSGIGIVRFHKKRQEITFESWPYLADPKKPGTQFPGWPVSVSMLDNYCAQAKAWLPMMAMETNSNPVVQVINEESGEIIYTLRTPKKRFQPWVFADGKYTVRISLPDSALIKELKGLTAVPKLKASQQLINVTL